VVTDGGPRDTDVVIEQGIPVYSRGVDKTVPPGRVDLDGEQVPVDVAGARVRPDGVVVADGDGVVVVPLESASEVAERAREVLDIDREHRREDYEKVGLDPDFTQEGLHPGGEPRARARQRTPNSS
jgi:regulator of RNase E activity RraA